MSTDEDRRPLPQMHKLTDEEASTEREGYWWVTLPSVPTLFGVSPFGGGGDSRASLCLRCGAFVGVRGMHDVWHDSLAAGVSGSPTGDGEQR